MSELSESVTGTIELDVQGRAFVRDGQKNYRAEPTDVTVGPELLKRYRIRGGESVSGIARLAPAKGGSNGKRKGKKKPAPPATRLELAEIEAINDRSVDEHLDTRPFEDLTAIDPDRRIRFSTPGGPTTMNIVDLMTPIGFGQRGLICAPPRTGKTVLLHQMAEGIAVNHPDACLFVLLVDERPEEVTVMRRGVKGEVVYSSNDSDPDSHVRISRLVIAKAKRLVEAGRDVIVLMDSLTRLGRAFNNQIRGGGRIMSGGIDSKALIEPKAIFGAARNVEGGASLTIVATALIETGSRMDDVIFNEFKGTGNMEIMLSRELANMRIWPAIDLNASGTRKEEKLLTPQELACANYIRRSLHGQGVTRSMQTLLNSMAQHKQYDAFVKAMAART